MAKKKVSKTNHKKLLVLGAILLILTLGLYFQITDHAFVNYDDDTLITKNRVVVDPGTALRACFEWNVFSPHFKPLVLMSWRAEYQMFGENPAVFHFNNLLLHAFNVLMVFMLSLSLLPKFIKEKSQQTIAAFFIALLFSLHPLHVESVAWAVERKDVLYTFFFLLSWWAYLQYLEKEKYMFLMLSGVFFLLVLLSKSMGITLPAILFLTDYVYQRKNIVGLIKEKIPFLALLIFGVFIYGLGTYFSNFFSGGVVGTNTNINEALQAASEANPALQIVLMAFLKVALLLLHVLLPAHISVIYEGTVIQEMIGGLIYVIPFLLSGLVYLAYRFSQKNSVYLFGLLFFFITVSPAIAIGKYGGVGVFAGDRYTYAPMLGLIISLVVLFYQIPIRSASVRNGLLGALCAIYFFISYQAIGVWKNAETLWTNAINKTVCSAPAYNGRGVYYMDITQEKNKALEDFNHSIACDSTHSRASYNRGLILQEKNKPDEALADYNRAIRYNPEYIEAFVNRGNLLRDQKDYTQGLADYNRALQLNPTFSKAYFNRGGLFLNQKEYTSAIQDYTSAISFDPSYAKAYYNRGLCYFNMNDKESACQNFTLAAQYGYSGSAKTIQEYCK